MIPFRFRITLLDPLFYSREGLAASHTPKILHATAINGAVCASMGLNAEHQPFVMSDDNGGMDTPRYESSIVTDDFYFTPAAPLGDMGDWVEMVKGDNEGFRFATVAGEILKASGLHFIAPESQFAGLGLLLKQRHEFPRKLRLGSFRGMANLDIEFASRFKPLNREKLHAVDHPVDPLVSNVTRGVMNNMFPYPVVSNAACRKVYEITFDKPKLGRKTARLAWPDSIDEPQKPERGRSGSTAIL